MRFESLFQPEQFYDCMGVSGTHPSSLTPFLSLTGAACQGLPGGRLPVLHQAGCPSPPPLGAVGEDLGNQDCALAFVKAGREQSLVGPARQWRPVARPLLGLCEGGGNTLESAYGCWSLQSLPGNQALSCCVSKYVSKDTRFMIA